MIWCEPAARPAVEKFATPPDSTTALPTGVPSIANWTVPSADAGATVAVNVTVAPSGAGFRFDVERGGRIGGGGPGFASAGRVVRADAARGERVGIDGDLVEVRRDRLVRRLRRPRRELVAADSPVAAVHLRLLDVGVARDQCCRRRTASSRRRRRWRRRGATGCRGRSTGC